MSNFEVPYLPIFEFNPSEVTKKFSDACPENEELNDDKVHLKDLRRSDLTEEVALILLGMGMEKYINIFKEIAVDTFLNLSEADLQEIGITDLKDRRVIAQNLRFHQRNINDLIVSENHFEDLKIIQNVSQQLILLQNYSAYIELQMRKQTLIDYAVDSENSACTFLKAFAECALTQSKIMSSRLYDVNDSQALINKHLKMYNLTIPNELQDSLPKKKERKCFLKIVVLISVSSLLILTGTYMMRRN